MPLKIEIDLRISAALIHNQVWFLHTNKSYLELRNGRLTEDKQILEQPSRSVKCSCFTEKHIENPIKHLIGAFFSKIVNA